ncbi:MAG: hypothetical protein GF308_10705 [Candidatus Heimdallarchaeota archaeon]|nr:hypothetical protein [Candidatus Heimdallarchaeota archaeon]
MPEEDVALDESNSYEEAILKELRTIREQLEPKEEPEEEKVKEEKEEEGFTPKKATKKFIDNFIDFLKKYQVMGLAVAFIMGIYLGNLVEALVNDLIMPILDFIPGLDTWNTFTAGPFLIGHFVNTLVTFMLIAFVIYLLVKLTSKMGLE